jgi:hypothetical protein
MHNTRHFPNLITLLRLFIVVFVVFDLLVTNSDVTAQTNAVTYQNPLVYIGIDGNYYVTNIEGINATAVTSGMVDSDVDSLHNSGSRPYWSPQGNRFAFIKRNKLYVVTSGKLPESVVSNNDLTNSTFAWSPNSNQLAYVIGDLDRPNGLRTIEWDGSEVSNITLSSGRESGGGGGGCGSGSGGPGPERAWQTLLAERDISFGSIPLQWTSQGFVFSVSCPYFSTFLISIRGRIEWKLGKPYTLIISPDGTRALTRVVARNNKGTTIMANDEYSTQLALLDLVTGEMLPLAIGINAEPMGWSNDGKTIIFATQTLKKEIDGANQNSQAEDHQEHIEYALTLWRHDLDHKQPIRLFEHKGYAFGIVTVSPDDSIVVFSLISNNYFDKVNPESQIVAVPINGGPAQWIAIGGKPSFGKGPFTAISAHDLSVQPLQCPKSLASRLRIGQRAKVTPGAPKVLRAGPAKGADVRTMAAGSAFLVLDGPTCGSDGRAWWQVNYRGVVGWTAESDGKTYWLEQ